MQLSVQAIFRKSIKIFVQCKYLQQSSNVPCVLSPSIVHLGQDRVACVIACIFQIKN